MGMHGAHEMPGDKKCVLSVTLLGREISIVASSYDIPLVYNFSVNSTFYNTVLL